MEGKLECESVLCRVVVLVVGGGRVRVMGRWRWRRVRAGMGEQGEKKKCVGFGVGSSGQS